MAVIPLTQDNAEEIHDLMDPDAPLEDLIAMIEDSDDDQLFVHSRGLYAFVTEQQMDDLIYGALQFMDA